VRSGADRTILIDFTILFQASLALESILFGHLFLYSEI
jgi:hypothetical protein